MDIGAKSGEILGFWPLKDIRLPADGYRFCPQHGFPWPPRGGQLFMLAVRRTPRAYNELENPMADNTPGSSWSFTPGSSWSFTPGSSWSFTPGSSWS
jgi:hypothetical protein